MLVVFVAVLLAQTPPPQTIVTVDALGRLLPPTIYIDDAGWVWNVGSDGTLGPDCTNQLVPPPTIGGDGGRCYYASHDCSGSCLVPASWGVGVPQPRVLFCVYGYTNRFALPSDTATPHSAVLNSMWRYDGGVFCLDRGPQVDLTPVFSVDELQVVTATPLYTWPTPVQPFHQERR